MAKWLVHVLQYWPDEAQVSGFLPLGLGSVQPTSLTFWWTGAQLAFSESRMEPLPLSCSEV